MKSDHVAKCFHHNFSTYDDKRIALIIIRVSIRDGKTCLNAHPLLLLPYNEMGHVVWAYCQLEISR